MPDLDPRFAIRMGLDEFLCRLIAEAARNAALLCFMVHDDLERGFELRDAADSIEITLDVWRVMADRACFDLLCADPNLSLSWDDCDG